MSNAFPAHLMCSGIRLDVERQRGMVAGVDLGLSQAEFALLHVLFSNRSVPMSKASIATSFETPVEPRMIDVYVSRTRAKLAAVGRESAIETVWGRGYRAIDIDHSEPADPPTSRGLGAALAPA